MAENVETGKRGKNRLFTDQYAVSNIVATLVLIGVAVAGGVMVFEVLGDHADMLAGAADFHVQSIDVIAARDVNAASVTILNVGNVMLPTVRITISGEGGAAIIMGAANVAPGKTRGIENFMVPRGTWIAGNSYKVLIDILDNGRLMVSRMMTTVARG